MVQHFLSCINTDKLWSEQTQVKINTRPIRSPRINTGGIYLHVRLGLFELESNKSENVFGYSLKEGTPLVNNSSTSDNKQVSS